MPLTVTIDYPADVEEKLSRHAPDLAADIREAYALELFRRREISHFDLSRILGLDRLETDVYLQRHGVFEGSLTMDDLESDLRTIRSVCGDTC